MEEIREIVDYLEIDEKKEKANHNRIIIPHIRKLMSDLCFYSSVHHYVNYKNKILDDDLSFDDKGRILEALEQ